MEVYFCPDWDSGEREGREAQGGEAVGQGKGHRNWFLWNPVSENKIEFESVQKCREVAVEYKYLIDVVRNTIYASGAPEPIELENGRFGLALYADGFFSVDDFRTRFLDERAAIRAWREPSGEDGVGAVGGVGEVKVTKIPVQNHAES